MVDGEFIIVRGFLKFLAVGPHTSTYTYVRLDLVIDKLMCHMVYSWFHWGRMILLSLHVAF